VVKTTKLHVGCGGTILGGWINIDRRAMPGVDRVHDVRRGLPYDNVDFIFGEHFLEQLPLADGLRFLAECRRALAEHGILRLTTPNLDWVWHTHYTPDAGVAQCLDLNRAFHGWGHHFLYNRPMLTRAIAAAGFAAIDFVRYGESRHDALRTLESHPHAPDFGAAESLLIIEASGRATPDAALWSEAAAHIYDMAIE
jgi:predicted SAM-dependent methyltransferase